MGPGSALDTLVCHNCEDPAPGLLRCLADVLATNTALTVLDLTGTCAASVEDAAYFEERIRGNRTLITVAFDWGDAGDAPSASRGSHSAQQQRVWAAIEAALSDNRAAQSGKIGA